ncbi:hypothetical protein SAMN05421720_11277 [Rhodospira trueperi]|uniref:Uncharacterized protein n=1 Tax=Rhodospira trueperi TaxID=69960 RepID=A0A1G7FU95_9PROT|nr:hypothetical protein SAMN05421720_11277 [Rhodospira trueperi]
MVALEELKRKPMSDNSRKGLISRVVEVAKDRNLFLSLTQGRFFVCLSGASVASKQKISLVPVALRHAPPSLNRAGGVQKSVVWRDKSRNCGKYAILVSGCPRPPARAGPPSLSRKPIQGGKGRDGARHCGRVAGLRTHQGGRIPATLKRGFVARRSEVFGMRLSQQGCRRCDANAPPRPGSAGSSSERRPAGHRTGCRRSPEAGSRRPRPRGHRGRPWG